MPTEKNQAVWERLFDLEPFIDDTPEYKVWFESRVRRILKVCDACLESTKKEKAILDSDFLEEAELDLVVANRLGGDDNVPSLWQWHNLLLEFAKNQKLTVVPITEARLEQVAEKIRANASIIYTTCDDVEFGQAVLLFENSVLSLISLIFELRIMSVKI